MMETLLVEAHGPVLLIRLNRPTALNAINAALSRELLGTLSKFEVDPNLRCAVITASEKVFAAGADVNDMVSKTTADMLAENCRAGTAARPRHSVREAAVSQSLRAGRSQGRHDGVHREAKTGVYREMRMP